MKLCWAGRERRGVVNSGKVSFGNILMKKAKSLSGVLSMRPDFLKIQGRHFLKFLIF